MVHIPAKLSGQRQEQPASLRAQPVTIRKIPPEERMVVVSTLLSGKGVVGSIPLTTISHEWEMFTSDSGPAPLFSLPTQGVNDKGR